MSPTRIRLAAIAASAAMLIVAPAGAQSPEPSAGAPADAVLVTGVDYAFNDLPTSLPVGTVVSFANGGAEVHEIIIVRIKDDTTETLEELMAMDQAEAETKTEQVGFAFAMPGEVATDTITLPSEGRYVAICAVPQGMNLEDLMALGVTEDMDQEDWPPEAQAIFQNPPHFQLGMMQAFTVTAADSTPGPLPEPAESEAPAPSGSPDAM